MTVIEQLDKVSERVENVVHKAGERIEGAIESDAVKSIALRFSEGVARIRAGIQSVREVQKLEPEQKELAKSIISLAKNAPLEGADGWHRDAALGPDRPAAAKSYSIETPDGTATVGGATAGRFGGRLLFELKVGERALYMGDSSTAESIYRHLLKRFEGLYPTRWE